MSLLVILGAGASFDCLPLGERGAWVPPPLAANLFSAGEYGVAIKAFPQMAGVVHRLRGLPPDVSVEQRLEELQDDAATYPRAHVELMAIRYYLRWVLTSCSQQTLAAASRVTNYATLVSTLERWRHRSGEKVVVVNFNYDTIFDDAFRTQLGVADEGVDGHINGAPGWHHIKLHGSCDWAVMLGNAIAHPIGMPGPGPSDVIAAAASAKPTPSYLRWDWDGPEAARSFVISGPHFGTPVMPAIAVPLRTKSAFSCPVAHLELLREQLLTVNRILTIGWRGQDEHFLREIHGPAMKRCEVLLVTASEEGGLAVKAGLVGTGMPADYEMFHTGTSSFTRLLQSDVLNTFLARAVA